MNSDIEVNKPKPIALDENLKIFKRGSDIDATLKALVAGEVILIEEFYSDGLALLKEVHRYLRLKRPNNSFEEQRDFRAEYYKLSNQVLIEISDQKLCAKKAPSIGWLAKFYLEDNRFLLTFPQIQGLNSAWQWLKNGVFSTCASE